MEAQYFSEALAVLTVAKYWHKTAKPKYLSYLQISLFVKFTVIWRLQVGKKQRRINF